MFQRIYKYAENNLNKTLSDMGIEPSTFDKGYHTFDTFMKIITIFFTDIYGNT